MTDWTWPLGAPADTRSSLRIFSITPNWKDGVLEQLEWLTSVTISETDNEQRRSVRVHPRRSFEATFMRVGAQRQRLDAFLTGVGPAVFLVPIWHEQFKLPDGRADGVIPMPEAGMREFNVGDLLMISNGDPNDFGMLKMISKAANSITVASYTNLGAWPKGSRVTPLRVGMILDQLTLSAPRQDVAEVPMRFVLTEADTSVVPSWGAVDFMFPFKPDRSEPLTLNYGRNVFVTDFDTGVFDVFDTSKVERVATTLMIKLFGRADIYAFRRFLYAARGRAVRFWAPTFMQDITPIEDLSGDTIVAAANGFDDSMVTPQSVRKFIAIQTNDVTHYRELASVLTERQGRKQVATLYTVTEALPALAIRDVKSISFMVESRFDNDAFDLLHRTDDAAHMSTSVLLRSAKQTDALPPLPVPPASTATFIAGKQVIFTEGYGTTTTIGFIPAGSGEVVPIGQFINPIPLVDGANFYLYFWKVASDEPSSSFRAVLATFQSSVGGDGFSFFMSINGGPEISWPLVWYTVNPPPGSLGVWTTFPWPEIPDASDTPWEWDIHEGDEVTVRIAAT